MKNKGFLSIIIICGTLLALSALYPEQSNHLILRSDELKLVPLTLFTHMFMHANFLHFFYNMFFVAPFAVYYESQVGTKRFVRDFILCGLGGAIFFIAMPSLLGFGGILGTSGACNGLFVLGILSFKHDKYHRLMAHAFLIGLFMMNLIPGIFDCFMPSETAHMAHVGGMLTAGLIHVLRD